jgi:hypothetical protein
MTGTILYSVATKNDNSLLLKSRLLPRQSIWGTQMTESTYAELSGRMQTGDILLFNGPGFESGAIEWEDGTPYSHVAIVVRLPEHPRALLWTSDEISAITDALDSKKAPGVHLLDLEKVLQDCMAMKFAHGQIYHFVWRALVDVTRDALFMQKLESFMHSVDGAAFPSFAKLVEQFALGKLDIKTSLTSFFCSELASDTYMHLALLPTNLPPNHYSPGSFAQSKNLQLLGGASLGVETPFVLS